LQSTFLLGLAHARFGHHLDLAAKKSINCRQQSNARNDLNKHNKVKKKKIFEDAFRFVKELNY
jgi:hypothetical protein